MAKEDVAVCAGDVLSRADLSTFLQVSATALIALLIGGVVSAVHQRIDILKEFRKKPRWGTVTFIYGLYFVVVLVGLGLALRWSIDDCTSRTSVNCLFVVVIVLCIGAVLIIVTNIGRQAKKELSSQPAPPEGAGAPTGGSAPESQPTSPDSQPTTSGQDAPGAGTAACAIDPVAADPQPGSAGGLSSRTVVVAGLTAGAAALAIAACRWCRQR